MSGGGWQEGEQGLPGLPDGHRGGSPPYSTDHGQGDVHRGGRGAYSEGQGDIQRFLEDVEASGKPRYIIKEDHTHTNFSIELFRASTPSLSVSSGGSRGCTPPLNHWDRPGSSRFLKSCFSMTFISLIHTRSFLNQEWFTIKQKSFKVSLLWKEENSSKKELRRRQFSQHIN